MITSWEVDQAFEVSAAAIVLIDSEEATVGKIKPTGTTEINREDDFVWYGALHGIHWIDGELRWFTWN